MYSKNLFAIYQKNFHDPKISNDHKYIKNESKRIMIK